MLPDDYTLANYATVFADSTGMITNTLLYCGLAATIDVVIGVAIACWCARIPARQWLDFRPVRRLRYRESCWRSAIYAPASRSADADHSNVAVDHAGLFSAATALRAALVHGRVTAAQSQSRRSCRDAWGQQMAIGAGIDSADGWRHSRRVRIELHHRRCRTFGDDSAGSGNHKRR